LFDPFDVVVLSHEVGFIKDQKEVFVLVTELLGVTPESVFSLMISSTLSMLLNLWECRPFFSKVQNS